MFWKIMGNIGLTFLGFVVGILAVGLLVLLTVFIYFRVDERQNNKGKKNAAFIVLAIVFAIAFLFRFVAAIIVAANVDADQNYFVKSLFESIFAFYTSAGAFTLEGQEGDFFENIKNFEALRILYFASLLWMAASFFLIISSRVSYSFSSKMRLWWRRKFLLFNPYSIYIFTNASDDALNLAESIEDHHLAKKDKRFLIIFSSDELDEFDRNNELHSKIRADGYYYRVLYKTKEKKDEKQLLRELGIFWGCRFFKNIAKHSIRIFAFNSDEKDKGLESKNSDIVIDDFDRLFLNVFKNKRVISDEQREMLDSLKPPYIEYYVLSNSGMNYEFYQKTIIKKIQKHFDVSQFKPTDYDLLKQMVQIHIVNEASMAGENLVEQRQKNESDFLVADETYPINYTKDNKKRVLVIGFGQTGQRALDNIFEDSAAVVKKGKLYIPSEFEAVICDKNMDEIAGTFIQTHPSYLFKIIDEHYNPKTKYINEDKLEIRYDIKYPNYFNKIKTYVGFPTVLLAKRDYNDPEFIEEINEIVGLQTSSSYRFSSFDTVVVSVGDDEENIKIANSLLSELRRELYKDDGSQIKITQRIFVNIRDEKNFRRLNWNTDIEMPQFANVYVYPFGNRLTIYSYDKIIEEGPFRYVNTLYKYLNDHDSMTIEDIKKLNPYDEPINKTAYPLDKRNKMFLGLNPMKKESNEHSSRFANYVREYIRVYNDGTDLDYLGNLEHIRWCRFHMANGYVFNSSFFEKIKGRRDELTSCDKEFMHYYENGYTTFASVDEYGKCILKLHSCIIPYDLPSSSGEIIRLLPDTNRRYDYFNTKYARYVAPPVKK